MTVRLTWPGKRWQAQADSSTKPRALEAVERSGDAAQRIIFGDALDVAEGLASEGLGGKVDLVYVDPPYASQADYTLEARLDGHADGRVRRTVAYEDTWSKKDGGVSAYLEMLAPRLEAMTALLSPKGTIWVHVDWRASYFVRVLLDEIMGAQAFKNEIVWRRAPNLGRQAVSGQFGRTLDTLVVYGKAKAVLTPPTRLEPIAPEAIRWDARGKDARPFTTAPRGDYTDASIARLDLEGRVHRTATGKVYIKYFLQKNKDGEWCRERRVDALWTDVPPLRHAKKGERTGFPTQKPLALLERVIQASTAPGAIVVDLFSGSGTTGEAAHRLGRRAILGDRGPASIATSRARLLRAGAGLSLEAVAGQKWPKGKDAKIELDVQKDGRSFVHLREPSEPLAWTLGTFGGRTSSGKVSSKGPFICQWHDERQPGARTVACATRALMDGQVSKMKTRARIYADDGAVSEARIGA